MNFNLEYLGDGVLKMKTKKGKTYLILFIYLVIVIVLTLLEMLLSKSYIEYTSNCVSKGAINVNLKQAIVLLGINSTRLFKFTRYYDNNINIYRILAVFPYV